jgi:DNA primase
VTLPPGEDPDTLVRGSGEAALQGHIDDALDVLDRKLQILEAKGYFASIERTRAALDRLLPTIRAAADPALRDIYVTRVAERTGVRRETLEAEIQRARSRPGRDAPPPVPPAAPSRRPGLPKLGAERQLLLLMVRGVEWADRAVELISAEDFEDPHYRAIFQVLLEDPETRSPPPSMDPVAAQRFEEILADQVELGHGIDVFTQSVNRMRVSALDRRIHDLQSRIEAAAGDQEKGRLATEKQSLTRERNALGPPIRRPRESASEAGKGSTNSNQGSR